MGEGAIRRYTGANDSELGERLAEVGMTEDACLQEMGRLAESIPQAKEEVFEEPCAARIPGALELSDRLLPRVEKNCARTLALLWARRAGRGDRRSLSAKSCQENRPGRSHLNAQVSFLVHLTAVSELGVRLRMPSSVFLDARFWTAYDAGFCSLWSTKDDHAF